MRKKALFIVSRWIIGGREITIKNIIENLSDEWERELLLLRPPEVAIADEKSDKIPFSSNTKVSRIEKPTRLSTFFSLVKFLRKCKPDIISYHIPLRVVDLLLLRLSMRLAGFSSPIVVTLHLRDPDSRPGMLMYLTSPLRKYLRSKEVDYVVAVSRDLQKEAEIKLGIGKDRITTIYNPIVGEEMFEKAKEEPEEYKAFPNSIKIVMVARLATGHKDFQTLLHAFSLLRERYREAKLFLVGEGEGREQILKWIEELGLNDNVLLLGPRLNPYPYIRYADIFVLSSFIEGLGMVIVEAMALGCPVVATNCPTGPRELIGNNENGILVPMRDPVKMAEAMMRILEDRELRERIIENGRKKAEEFRISTSVQKYERFFNNLLEKGRDYPS